MSALTTAMSVPTCNIKQHTSQPPSRKCLHSPTTVKLQRCIQTKPFSSRVKGGHQAHRHASRSLLAAAEATGSTVELAVGADSSPSTSGKHDAVPRSAIWELDFSSRPVLDERGKKKWELLICDPARSWTFSRYFPNNKINSTQVEVAWKLVVSQMFLSVGLAVSACIQDCKFFRKGYTMTLALGTVQILYWRYVGDIFKQTFTALCSYHCS